MSDLFYEDDLAAHKAAVKARELVEQHNQRTDERIKQLHKRIDDLYGALLQAQLKRTS